MSEQEEVGDLGYCVQCNGQLGLIVGAKGANVACTACGLPVPGHPYLQQTETPEAPIGKPPHGGQESEPPKKTRQPAYPRKKVVEV